MSKAFKIGFVSLVVIGALAVLITGTVLAQDDTPTPPDKPFGWHGRGPGFGMGRGPGGQVGLEAAAEALGMTADELSTQLWGGRTLADLAEEAGIALEDVQAAVQAAVEEATREAIEQAVADGTLSREHADWLLEGLDKGFWGGRGFGGFGGHHFHHRGGFGGSGRFQRPGNGNGTSTSGFGA